MNASSNSTEHRVVTDIWGNVDVAYYESQAMRMRNEFLQAAFVTFAKRIKDAFIGLFSSNPSTHGA